MKGLREKCLGEKGESFCQERSVRNEKNHVDAIYRKTWNSMDRKVSSFKFSPDEAIEELSRGVHSKVTSMDWEAIEHTETSLIDQEVVEQLSRLILKNLDGSVQ